MDDEIHVTHVSVETWGRGEGGDNDLHKYDSCYRH